MLLAGAMFAAYLPDIGVSGELGVFRAAVAAGTRADLDKSVCF